MGRAKHLCIAFAAVFVLSAGPAAHAQFGGGQGHGGRGSHQGGDEGGSGAGRRGGARQDQDIAPDKVDITGVIQSFGPEPDRVTITYGAVDALNWPAGTTPFVVANPTLLTGLTVGEKVRFRLESAHIYALAPVK